MEWQVIQHHAAQRIYGRLDDMHAHKTSIEKRGLLQCTSGSVGGRWGAVQGAIPGTRPDPVIGSATLVIRLSKPEVMSPAGYWPQLRAAIEAGADAVYFGLKHFTARAKVGFTLEELADGMRTLHRRGVRGYITVNTLISQHELG